jgi:hypothetical protein
LKAARKKKGEEEHFPWNRGNDNDDGKALSVFRNGRKMITSEIINESKVADNRDAVTR